MKETLLQDQLKNGLSTVMDFRTEKIIDAMDLLNEVDNAITYFKTHNENYMLCNPILTGLECRKLNISKVGKLCSLLAMFKKELEKK